MTVKELYENIGGSLDSALRVLQMEKLVAKFVVRYLNEESCEKLLSAYESGNAQVVFESAHAMKGVCANLGLDRLSETASEICEQFRPGKARTLTDAEPVYDEEGRRGPTKGHLIDLRQGETVLIPATSAGVTFTPAEDGMKVLTSYIR